jgi:hypothetical protein
MYSSRTAHRYGDDVKDDEQATSMNIMAWCTMVAEEERQDEEKLGRRRTWRRRRKVAAAA